MTRPLLPSFSEKMKPKIKLKNRVYKKYIKNGRPEALIIYCRTWRLKFLLISQNSKMITLHVLDKTLVILLAYTGPHWELHVMQERLTCSINISPVVLPSTLNHITDNKVPSIVFQKLFLTNQKSWPK